jgi:hypothetical protein
MSYFDYTDINAFVYDEELIRLLCFDQVFDELLDRYTRDDFLIVDSGTNIPFFAEIRNYRGAIEAAEPKNKWLVKPIKGNDQIMTEMSMVVYFIDLFTRTLSVPVIITKIDGVMYRATKLISKAEQLSGANYTVYPELIEQLALDMINRWIFYDEDRNPNNYLIRYNSQNRNLILAIDFGNCDLLFEEMKIKGLSKQFGWQRKEKTRYLTPLKSEHFLRYDMEFFNLRFESFEKLEATQLRNLASKVLRFQPDKDRYAEIIARNIIRRRNYVQKYFAAQIPARRQESDTHSAMGKSFQTMFR